MTNKRIYVDIHALQTVPPSCINRDDTGSPKSATYGGVNRARVSSQSWKRAMRNMFEGMFDKGQLGVRTKKIVSMVAEEMKAFDSIENPEKAAEQILKTAGLKIKSAEKGTDALFFMSRAQAKALAKLAADDPETLASKPATDKKKAAETALREAPGIDVALFGRMVADNPSLNTDACVQVAHAISTHAVNTEYDYFTAVDDLTPDDSAGAGHIGTIEFNASTMYRYATIAVHELQKHLHEDTLSALDGFLTSFVRSMPTGRQNTFANRTLPDVLLVTVRDDQPVNMAGAFEKPVYAKEGGFVEPSANALISYAKKVYVDFADEPVAMFIVGKDYAEQEKKMTFQELREALKTKVDQLLTEK